MNKPTLVFQAPIATRSGYGDHSRDILYSLWKLNQFDIKIISTRWGSTPMDALRYDNEFHKWIFNNVIGGISEKPDIFIQVSVPNEFQSNGHYNIGVTAGIETTYCPPDWIIGCNRMDLIIVPSTHSKVSIAEISYNETDKITSQIVKVHKLEKPIEVIFEGFNQDVFKPLESTTFHELDSIKEDFAFLFVGHWLRGDLGEDRKNVGMLINTFALAFKNEKVKPALILKSSHATFSIRDREDIIRKIKSALGPDFGAVPIYLLHGDLSESEMNLLYNHPKIKAMLNFTKGEGFGRPLLEFSVTGKPIIVSNWGGHLDFLKTGAVLLPGELKNVHESAADQFLLKEAKWFNVNISKALQIIKDVFKNYLQYLPGAKQLSEENKSKFSIEKMTTLIDEVFTRHSVYTKIQPKFQQIQLPKLKMLNKDAKV
jgi:glycosyltransferase involved in cell wall biosynthesis